MTQALLALLLVCLASAANAGDRILMKNGTLQPEPVRLQSTGYTDSTAPRFLPTLGRTYYIVQFDGPIQDAWKEKLKAGGVELGAYLPEDSFIVRIRDLRGWGALNAMKDVTAVIPYKSNLRLSTEFQTYFAMDGGSQAVAVVKLAFPDEVDNVLKAMADKQIKFELVQRAENLLVINTTDSNLSAIADIEGVEWMEPYTGFQMMDFDVSDDKQGSQASPGDYSDLTGYESGTKVMNFDDAYARGFHGEGEKIGISDTGLDRGSLTDILDDFKPEVTNGYALGLFSKSWADPQGHGTHTSGSIVGSGKISGGKLHGGAYSANLVMQSLWSPMLNNLSVVPDFDKIFGAARRDENVHVHSNSWGSPKAPGTYDNFSAQVDDLSWKYPDMLIVFAAGNSGVDDNADGRIDENSISTPATAKNCLTVGASKNLVLTGGIQKPMSELRDGKKHWGVEPVASSKLSDRIDGIAAFSSRGPTMDGRIKPEIVAPGTNIISTRSLAPKASDLWGAYNDYYVYAGGTSMATPLTAGAAAIVRQSLKSKGFDNPSAALVKAVLMQSATDLFPGQFGTGAQQELQTTRPNIDEGFGRVNLATATNMGGAVLKDETTGLKTGESQEFTFKAKKGSVFRATLTYTDAPASASAAKALVNDLDLVVIDSKGEKHFPNHLSGPDRANNTEMVEFTASAGGDYKVEVSAHSVPKGRDDTGAQPYALVIE